MADTVTQVGVVKIETSEGQKSIQALKQEVKDLKNQLLNLDAGTEEYNKTLLKLGNTQHELVEINQQLTKTTSDFGDRIGNVTGTIAGMSGAVSAVTGTLSLLGVQIGDDAKLMKVLVSAMSITQGLSAIDAGIKSFKALRISIQAATAAQKGFNAAVLKNPYLLAGAAIVAAVVAVTKAISKQRTEEKQRHEEAMQHYQEEMEKQRELAKERAEALEDITRYEKAVSRMTAKELDAESKRLQENIADNQAVIQKFEGQITEAQKEIDKAAGYLNAPYLSEETIQAINDRIHAMQTEQETYRASIAALEKDNKLNEQKLDIVKKTTPVVEKAAKASQSHAKAVKDEYTNMEYLRNSIELRKAKGEDALEVMKDELWIEKEYLKTLTPGTEAYDKQSIVVERLSKSMKDLVKSRELDAIMSQKARAEAQATVNELTREAELLSTLGSLAVTENGNPYELLEQETARATLANEQRYENEKLRIQENYELQRAAIEGQIALAVAGSEEEMRLRDEKATLEAQYRLDTLTADTEFNDERVEIERTAAEKRKAINQSYVAAAASIGTQLGSILGSMADSQEEGTKQWKALKTAEAIINTISGGLAAFSSAMQLPYPANIIAAPITMAAVLATGFAQVKKIQETKVSKSASGSSSVRESTVQRLTSTPTNVRTTNPRWDDEGNLTDEVVNTGDQRVVLVMSDLEAAEEDSRRVSVSNEF